MIVHAMAVLVVLLAAPVAAQPQSQPLVQAGNLRYLGSVTFPPTDGTDRTPPELSALTFGGFGLGLGPDGQSLYYGCHDWHSMLARVSIPEIDGVGSIVERCTDVPNLAAVDDKDGGARALGGSLWWNGRLVVTGYAQYDGDADASASHFAGTSIAGLVGPVRLAGAVPGVVAGYMGVVPPEWRELLGGPALTGQCCLSIISRTSYGPAVSVFNPDQVGVAARVPSTQLVGYTASRPLAALSGAGSKNTLFNATTRVGGVAFPAGTRSVLFIGRHGTGEVCYGVGVTDPAQHDTRLPGGGTNCYDPVFDANGYHAHPYQAQVWAYDANDLAAVAAGKKRPHEVRPYATWALPDVADGAGDAKFRSAVYDPAAGRLYVVAQAGGNAPRAHVYQIDIAPRPTPPR
jgi:hypothetical protein